jgi:hypothetical protein
MAVLVVKTKESVAVVVNLSAGESLNYKVTVRGPQPIFRLVDSQTTELLMSNNDLPVATMPQVVFERRWPLPSEPTQKATTHTMGFQFIGAVSYRYEVEKKAANGTTVSVMDITYSSNSPEDSFFQDLQVARIGTAVH